MSLFYNEGSVVNSVVLRLVMINVVFGLVVDIVGVFIMYLISIVELLIVFIVINVLGLIFGLMVLMIIIFRVDIWSLLNILVNVKSGI